ncbi:hypothetical protein Q4498_15355 [Neptunomonas phycophila]|uniref:hypothetical protein n=1 Tax=Neptunomonas phycophila TaxID=1572645 RepID=UPI0026E2F1D1|nr:hypothetical protein [Neptunomonas phycophila]MDO6469487.1 hypothetical protein [Neptunomonas phycophila]
MKRNKKMFVVLLLSQIFWGEAMAATFDEIIDTLKYDSIGGYKVVNLLSNEASIPKQVLGVAVQHFDSKTSYTGGSSQVTLQFSKLGTGINQEKLKRVIGSFPSLTLEEEFGQTDFSWRFGGINCYISVHTEDDIFEYSCWK